MALHARRCARPPGRRGLFIHRDARVDSAVVLLWTLLYSGLLLRTRSDSGQDVRVCKFESKPVEGVYCEASDSSISSIYPCNITRLPNYHCYANEVYGNCMKYDVEYNISFGTGELTLSNLNETTLPIVIKTTKDDNDTNWLIETQNASVVIVTGLPGDFTVKNPYIFNFKNCPGCPLPTANWYPYPSKHKIVFEVLLEDKEIQVFGKEVLIRMYSSNDSTLIDDTICLMGLKPGIPKIISGRVNTRLTVRDVYDTQFCVNFEFTDPEDKTVKNNFNYGCGSHLNMTEPSRILITGEVGIPVWWPMVPASISAISLLVILTIFAAIRGWLRACFSSLLKPRRAIETNSDPSPNAPTVMIADATTVTATITRKPTVVSTPITKAFRTISASGEKRLSATSLEQSVPFLNGVGPKANDAFSSSIMQTRR